MQQGIKKLQWFEYLKVVFLEILNPLSCRVFANQVTYYISYDILIVPNTAATNYHIVLNFGEFISTEG